MKNSILRSLKGCIVFTLALGLFLYSGTGWPENQGNQGNKIIQLRYNFTKPSVAYIEETGYVSVSIEGLMNSVASGKPRLPIKAVKMLLPPDVDSLDQLDISVKGGSSRKMKIDNRVEPCPEAKPLDSFEIEIIPDESIYSSSKPYPSGLFDEGTASIQRLCGTNILVLVVNPVIYYPAPGEIEYYESITVSAKISDKISEPGRPTHAEKKPVKFRKKAHDIKRVREAVDNPELINTYTSGTGENRVRP